jgi:hypothetical protein
MRTKTDEELASAEQRHADDPERAELIARTRRFKSSWIELAEALVEVRKATRWKRWGYGSFEEYTRHELHLKPDTVEKLTGSFSFLQRSAPEVIARDGLRAPIPSFQAIDFWRKAEQEGAPEETLREIRHQVLDEHTSAPAIARKYKEILFPLGDDEKQAKETAQLRTAAKRLAELLEGTGAVPKRLSAEVKGALERLIEALAGDEAKAA